jgi:hypothetical protein
VCVLISSQVPENLNICFSVAKLYCNNVSTAFSLFVFHKDTSYQNTATILFQTKISLGPGEKVNLLNVKTHMCIYIQANLFLVNKC